MFYVSPSTAWSDEFNEISSERYARQVRHNQVLLNFKSH
jgi:hypothetical protein